MAAGSSAKVRGQRLTRSTVAGGSDLLGWIERRLGLTANGLIVIAVTVSGFIIAHFIASPAMLMLVYGGLITVVSAYVIGGRKLGLSATRSDLPSRVREGQSISVALVLSARRRVSTVVLSEELHPQLGNPVRIPVPVLSSGKQVEHEYAFSPRLRGVYVVGPLTATWSDAFGLTKHQMTLCEPAKIIVHPAIEPVHDRVISREWEDPPVRPPISKPWPTGFEFYGMRPYVAGDDPRRIVWRAFAQYGEYMVRESEQGITDRVTLVMDTDRSTHSPGEPSETFEVAVRAAASLGAKHLKDGFSLTVDTGDGVIAMSLRGSRSEISLLDTLAGLARGAGNLSGPLDRLLTTARGNSHYVIVTPYLSEKMASRMRLLMERGTSLLLAMVLWEDSDPMSLHRAGSLGCNVVELSATTPLELAFRRRMAQTKR